MKEREGLLKESLLSAPGLHNITNVCWKQKQKTESQLID